MKVSNNSITSHALREANVGHLAKHGAQSNIRLGTWVHQPAVLAPLILADAVGEDKYKSTERLETKWNAVTFSFHKIIALKLERQISCAVYICESVTINRTSASITCKLLAWCVLGFTSIHFLLGTETQI